MKTPLKNSYEAWFLALFAALAVIRFSFLFLAPLDLSPDEAYYWDWSRRLSWGYYSKPPMVAWLIGLSTRFFGANEIGVRLPAVILGLGTILAIYLFLKKEVGERAGFWGALIYSSTIGSAVSSYIMTIDAPLLFFWTLALISTWISIKRSLKGPKEEFAPWLISGTLVGLALLSKQTAISLPLATLLFLVLLIPEKNLFRKKGVYLFFLVQLFLLLPFLFWNYQHNFITFAHTAHHFKGLEEKGPLFNPRTFFEFLGSQFGLITPLTFLCLLFCAFCYFFWAIKSFKGMKGRDEKVHLIHFLVLSGFLPLLACLFLSLKQRVNANWPAPFYISLCLLLGLWVVEGDVCNSSLLRKIKEKVLPASVILGAILVILVYFSPLLLAKLGLFGKPFDPTIRLRGWKDLSFKVEKLLKEVPFPEKTILITRRRQTASELAFYVKWHPTVYRWNGLRGEVRSQYELWPPPNTRKGLDALLVFDADKGLKGIEGCFRELRPLGVIEIPLGNHRLRKFRVFFGKGLYRWKAN